MPDRRAPIGLPDRYRLEGHIARGGMAVVYAAHDTVLDRPVAVKVLAEHLTNDAVARQRFEREARAAAALSNHRSVVTIYDVGEHDGRAFIVMERREGSVADRLASGRRISQALALDWLHDTADALDAAHERGIVHRDVKPANLLLDEHDRVAVADFGIASLAHESQVTQTGQVLGSAAYISPEQAMGQPATAASDRYGLACVAFELLTGHRPYPGDSFAAQARAHVDDAVPRAHGLSAGAQAALARGMAKEPADRPPSSVALVEGLEAGLGAADDAASSTQVMAPVAPAGGGRGPEDGARLEPDDDDRDRPTQRSGPSRGLLLTLATVAALLIGVVVALAVTGADGDEGDQRAERTPTATRTAKPKPTKTPTPEPTPVETATPEPTETATPTPEPTEEPSNSGPGKGNGNGNGNGNGGNGGGQTANDLNAAGYERIQAGDYAGAVGFLTDAVAACGGSAELDPCGYALFNLGQALNRSGRPAEAIPLLQQRLDGFSYARGTVRKELRAACEAAGQDCG